MTEKIPQFYRRWIRTNVGVPFPSKIFRFFYHEGQYYAYLIGPGSKTGPDNLFIYIFLQADAKEKKKEPVFLKMHQIQDSEIVSK